MLNLDVTILDSPQRQLRKMRNPNYILNIEGFVSPLISPLLEMIANLCTFKYYSLMDSEK